MPLISFFHEPRERGRTYGLIRIAFGITSLLWLLSLHPLLSFFYGADGLCPLSSGDSLPFSLFQLWDSPVAVTVVWWCAVFNALLVTTGLGVRGAVIFQYLFLSTFFLTPCRPDNYGDQVFVSLSFLMIFFPSRDPLSLDAKIFGKREEFSPWLRRVMMITLSTLYFVPVLARLGGDHWWEGTAAWFVLANPADSRVWTWLAKDPEALPRWGSYLITYLWLDYEALFPFLIWVKKLRNPLVIVGLVFHLALGLVLDLGLVPLQMAVLFLACLDDDASKGLTGFFSSKQTGECFTQQ